MVDVARELAIRSLLKQGATREWAESHVEDARIENGQLSYRTRIDHPVEFYAGEFTVDNPLVGEKNDGTDK